MKSSFAVHPEPAALRRFLAADSSPDEARQIVGHLLHGCGECSRAARLLAPLLLESEVTSPRDRAAEAAYLGSLEAARLAEERSQELLRQREEAGHLVAALAVQPRERWEAAVRDDPRFRSWPLVELLLSSCRELGFESPAKAVQLAELAVAVSRHLDPDRYGAERTSDLRARAHGDLANALRISSDFREAERALATAKEHLELGTGDPLERAVILLIEASFHGSRGDFERAFALQNHVIRIARRFEDEHLHGKALIAKALFLSYAEQAEQAVALLYEGIELIDPAQEPRLVLVAWHNLILSLSYQGKHHEAREKLPYIRALHEKFGNRLDLLRLRWIEGRIALDLGEVEEAEETLERVRSRLIEAGVGYDAALVSLDLATLYLQQGDGAKMHRLAQEMLPIFKSRGVHREAIAALIVFQKAVEVENVTLGLVEEIGRFLRRARNNPHLRFRPSTR